MPIQSCSDNGKQGFKWGQQGKCYVYASGSDASKKEAKKKALAQGVAIGDIKFVMVDSTIPPYVVKHLKETKGYDVFVWGGDSLDTPFKPVHKFCMASNIKDDRIKFGKLETIINRYNISMFFSKEEYQHMKQYNQWIDSNEEDMNFAEGDGQVYKRWVQANNDSCPICKELDNMGYFKEGEARAYGWSDGFKFVELPSRGHAHSEIGEGNWSAPDSSCKCTIRATFSKKDLTGLR